MAGLLERKPQRGIVQDYILKMVEDRCIYLDNKRFIPTSHFKNGHRYWFRVFRSNGKIYSVLGHNIRWHEWLEDLRDECSLGAIET